MANDQTPEPATTTPQPQAAPPVPAEDTPREKSRKRRFFLILAVVVVVVLGAAYVWWLHARNYASTDDAFIDTHIVHVAPQITGRVLHVYVNDNAPVHKGELLVQIDAADFRARYDQAVAQQQQVEAQLAQARTQVRVSEAALARARADRTGAAAQAANAAAQLRRYRGLRHAYPAAVSDQQFDQALATATNLAARRQASAQQVASAREHVAVAHSAISSAKAQLATAQARLEQARLNLGYTQLRAPIDGTVAARSVAVGNYVQPGQQLLDIVPHNIWVTANFKETELARMRPGQKAYLKIDAYPGVSFVGHVNSIQRGAGQAFALLPPQNATGNFVKVVQRVPVKITIDTPHLQYVLGPGMSVGVTVRLRGGSAATALAEARAH